MCGIMGYVGPRPAVDVLLKGLKRLEYRGYDSAGVAYFLNSKIQIQKSEGKLTHVEKLIGSAEAIPSHCGIGHTRWATHGKPTTQNAHPHRTGSVVLVHNGIIENYLDIKARMIKQGYAPASETDSELFGFLVLEELKKGSLFVESVRKAFLNVEGACSVVVMSENDPDLIVGIRNASPLVAALDPKGGVILASDAQPIIEYTQEVTFLEVGDMVVGRKTGLEFFDFQTGKPIQRSKVKLEWTNEQLDRRGFPHYMLKEIHDQPQTVIDTVNGVLDRVRTDPFPLARQPGVDILDQAQELIFVAMGTSRHAALLGQYWLERWAGIPCSVEYASEFRYRDPVVKRGVAVVGISQSGETADTLAVIRDMRSRGVPTLGVTNVRGSTMTREAQATFFTSAGPEIGVAATKTFTAQMTMLLTWAGYLGLLRGNDTLQKLTPLFDQMIRLPHWIESMLEAKSGLAENAKRVAAKIANHHGYMFMGRGYSFPIALEGALKLKEIAYVHSEGYAAGELKHGPIALIDNRWVVIVLAPNDRLKEKTISNLQEVKARNAYVVGIGNQGDEELAKQCDEWIPIPLSASLTQGVDESLYPFFLSPIVQLLSYEIAVLKGTDIDQPRNLAKSVTVE